jgi:di/tricarboxylate transporter
VEGFVTPEISYILILFVIALILFATEVLEVDVIAVLMLLALTVPIPTLSGKLQILKPSDALANFGDETVILLICDFMLTAGLVRTGVTAEIGRRLYTIGAKKPKLLVPILLCFAAAVSAWLPNTVTTAVFLPIALGICQKMNISPSKVLMPLAFAVILGGTCTLIGTSTNLVISGRLKDYGLEPISLFEMTPVGVPLAIAGLIYLITVGRKIIPERHKGRDLTVDYKMRDYLAELLVLPSSNLVGKTLRDANIGGKLDLNVLGIIRDKVQIFSPDPGLVIQVGDMLLVEGKMANIMRIKDVAGIDIKPDVKLRDPDLTSAEVELAEIMLMPGSWLVGRTLKEAGFRERQNLTVLAINHHGGLRRNKLSISTLHAGDVLLVQGPRASVDRVALDRRNFLVLGEISSTLPRVQRGGMALSIFVGVVLIASLGYLTFPIAFVLGVVLMFLTGCLTPEEAYQGVNWKMMVLIACMIAFGDAMDKTGAAKYVADLIVEYGSSYGPFAIMSAFFVLTTILTQPMSNQAAALVVLPIAVGTAHAVPMDPRMLVMTITFAASCSFVTPLEPSCIMVYGPGRYRFRDFVVAGFGLSVVVYILTMLLVPVFWG